MILYIYKKKKWKQFCNETTMAALSPLKVHRHTPITLVLFILFTKYLKEVHITKRNSWIDREVAIFSIQEYHVPYVGVLVIVLIIFYIEDVIDKSVNW